MLMPGPADLPPDFDDYKCFTDWIDNPHPRKRWPGRESIHLFPRLDARSRKWLKLHPEYRPIFERRDRIDSPNGVMFGLTIFLQKVSRGSHHKTEKGETTK